MNILNFLAKPKVLEVIHGGFVIFWVGLWITAAFKGWLESVVFVSHLSVVALVLSSWAAWQAARTEVRQEKNEQRDDEQDEQIEQNKN